MKASPAVAPILSTGPALPFSIPVVIIFWSGQGIGSTVRGGIRSGFRIIAPVLFMHNLFSNVTLHRS